MTTRNTTKERGQGGGGGATFLGAAAGSVAGVIGAELFKGKSSQAAGQNPIDYSAILQALGAGLDSTNAKLDAIGSQLASVIAALVGLPGAAAISRLADKFGYDNQSIPPGQDFSVLNEGSGVGSLVWLLIDVQSPNAIVHIVLDNLQYDFNITQMIQEGLMFPMYPGAWITRADPIGPPPTYAMMFSVGTLDGYAYKQRIDISVTNNNNAPMILNHAYGIKWIYS